MSFSRRFKGIATQHIVCQLVAAKRRELLAFTLLRINYLALLPNILSPHYRAGAFARNVSCHFRQRLAIDDFFDVSSGEFDDGKCPPFRYIYALFNYISADDDGAPTIASQHFTLYSSTPIARYFAAFIVIANY